MCDSSHLLLPSVPLVRLSQKVEEVRRLSQKVEVVRRLSQKVEEAGRPLNWSCVRRPHGRLDPGPGLVLRRGEPGRSHASPEA